MTKKIGEILIEQGLITAKTVERSIERSRKLNQRLGRVLEESEIITDEEIAQALSIQFNYKTIKKLSGFQFPPEILQLVPKEVALSNLIFPLKKIDGKLAVAIADPTDMKIINNLARNLSLTIVPFIATRKEIIAAISRHYLEREPKEPQETTILIVEDDKLIATMLTNMLGRNGFHCVVAADGMEGYKTALVESPHVIITDKEMPKLDGYALLSALKSMPETERIPVLLLTSVTDPDEEARAFEKGFFDYLCKPVREVTLITRVKRALQSRDLGAEIRLSADLPGMSPRR